MKVTKTQTGVTSKVAIAAVLICVGIVFGIFGFNALVPTFLSPTAVSDAQTTPTGWTYVYGPNKKTATDWKVLIANISAGADVKIGYDIGNRFITCSEVEFVGSTMSCSASYFTNEGDKLNMLYTYVATATASSTSFMGYKSAYTYSGSGNFVSLPMSGSKGVSWWYVKR